MRPNGENRVGKQDRNGNGRQQRILLVDDNVDFTTSLSLLLESMGHDVRAANDGAEALATAREFRPDVAFLDLGLPGLSGYDLAREIGKLPEASNTVLIALSGWGQPQDRHHSRQAGFAMHLVKPVELATIQSVLQSMPRP